MTAPAISVVTVDRDLASEVANELREIDAKLGEFQERKVAAQDQLSRIDIRAPQDGIIHESTVHTVGGVIAQGETIMLIVPKSAKLTVEAKVAPQDIDQLHVGQQAMLRLSALNQRTTPEINGTLVRVSADITTEERTGTSYYTIRVDMDADEAVRLGSAPLVPGMPVEVFVQTGNRSVISYLTKPLHDQLTRAFREQ